MYVVTYVEVAPGMVAAATALIEPWAESERRADGNVRFEVLRRSAPTNQFAIVAIWRDGPAFETRRASPASKEFLDGMAPLLISAIDVRVHASLAVASDEAEPQQDSVCVITHVDVPPPQKDDCISLLLTLAQHSREEAGCVRFEIFQQIDRPNHFSVVEAWKNRDGYEAHIVAGHAVAFRMALTPISGALYDERLYTVATLG